MQDKLRDHIEKIITVTDEEFSLIVSRFSQLKLRKHHTIFQEGDEVNYIYFIVSGLLKLEFTNSTGRRHIVSFAMESSWESDFNAYFTRSTTNMTLKCLENCDVYCIALKDYLDLCHALPKIESYFLKVTILGLINSQQRLLNFIGSTPKERYEALLKQQPMLYHRVSKTQISNYLRISRETLSKLTSNSDYV